MCIKKKKKLYNIIISIIHVSPRESTLVYIFFFFNLLNLFYVLLDNHYSKRVFLTRFIKKATTVCFHKNVRTSIGY